MYIVGVDIGGTSIRAGLVRDGKIIRKIKIKTKKTKRQILNDLVEIINWIIKDIDKKKIKGIGVGVPGPANYITGLIINPPNLKQLWKFNIKKFIEAKLKIKVKIDNDVHCIAIAEKHFGQGKKLKNFVVLAIGTGIGGGLIIDGKHYEGLGNAGEVGATIIHDNSKKTRAYGFGSLEGLASGHAITKMAIKQFKKKLIASQLAKLAKKGNKKARMILETAGKHLGVGLANVVDLYDPDLIILAGGVRESGTYILNAAKKQLNRLVKFKHCDVVWSRLDEPGILGASALFLE